MPLISIPAIEVLQSRKKCYLCSFTYRDLIKFFQFVNEEMDLIERHQRTLNIKRAREIGDYIYESWSQEDKYIIPPIVASLDADQIRYESDRGGGMLQFDMGSARLLINDGQHRRRGIEFALEDDAALANEQVGVFLIPDVGLMEAQQIFADINATAKLTNKSINLLFDHRSDVCHLSKVVRERVKIFYRYVDLERSTPAKHKLFVFSRLHNSNTTISKALWEDGIPQVRQDELVSVYWQAVSESLPEWATVCDAPELSLKKMKSYLGAIKKETLAFHGVTLQALARLGAEVIPKFAIEPNKMFDYLKPLSNVNLSKHNGVYRGNVLVPVPTRVGFKIVSNYKAIDFLYSMFRYHLGIIPEMPVQENSTAVDDRQLKLELGV